MIRKAALLLAASAGLALPACAGTPPPVQIAAQGPASGTAQDFRARPVTDEVIYFVLPDRFANGDTQ